MAYKAEFLSVRNFELAFQRLVRSGDSQYKQFYFHLLPAYDLALRENLRALIAEIKAGNYKPSKPTIIYLPKKSGILRPLSLLSVTDLVVYQAILNVVARAFEREQSRFAGVRSFGALYSGASSPFFFRPWKTGYQSFNNTLKAAFQAGADYFAEFDLVSCYELVDHTLLRAIVGAKVKDQDLLDLLFECLRAWTCHSSSSLGHGLPQGPEPSAFLAECLLFKLDGLNLKGVTCLRYIDDIKLLGQEAASLRRSLLRLDLASKELGLVPQAQKITLPRKVHSTKEILKTVPSLAKLKTPSGKVSQRALFKILKSSMRRHGNKWLIEDVTKFKFALFRLNPRVALLRRLGLLLADRPDLAPTLGQYFKKFPKNRAAASLLHSALKTDPVYDLAAASYVEAMDVCEPSKNYQAYRKTIRTIAGKSEEKSILLPIASSVFFGRRSTPAKAIALVRRAKDPRTKGILVHRLFGDSSTAPFSPLPAAPLLEELTKEADADLARYCAGLLLSRVSSNWKASGVNFSVQLLLFGLGLISKSPRKPGILETFFHVKMGILVPIDWRLALRADLPDAERRCLRLQKLMNSDPTARIMMLDTFNELLSQAFSLMEPSLAPTYKVVAGKNLHPDYGFWLNRPEFVAVVPRTVTWFRAVHAARVKADLAHAKQRRPAARGAPTLPIGWKDAKTLMGGAQSSWAELIKTWAGLIPIRSKRKTTVKVPATP